MGKISAIYIGKRMSNANKTIYSFIQLRGRKEISFGTRIRGCHEIGVTYSLAYNPETEMYTFPRTGLDMAKKQAKVTDAEIKEWEQTEEKHMLELKYINARKKIEKKYPLCSGLDEIGRHYYNTRSHTERAAIQVAIIEYLRTYIPKNG